MDLIVRKSQLRWGENSFPFHSARNGFSAHKVEGDEKTPIGSFPFRRVFYRPDRFSQPPITSLPLQALTPQDGWCDDPDDSCYNQFVLKPYPARHEDLWREDSLYDLILVVGHNDAPVEKGKGSAIFVHLFSHETKYTAGCIALREQDLLKVLQEATLESHLIVEA